MRLKFDYQMAVYELYEYGDVHDMICYCVFSFCLCFFTDKCNILHEAEVSSFLSVSVLQTSAISCTRLKFDYQMNVYELYEYGDVLVMNCNCVSHNLCFRAKIRKLSFFSIFSSFFTAIKNRCILHGHVFVMTVTIHYVNVSVLIKFILPTFDNQTSASCKILHLSVKTETERKETTQ